jgi:hypothetical protein
MRARGGGDHARRHLPATQLDIMAVPARSSKPLARVNGLSERRRLVVAAATAVFNWVPVGQWVELQPAGCGRPVRIGRAAGSQPRPPCRAWPSQRLRRPQHHTGCCLLVLPAGQSLAVTSARCALTGVMASSTSCVAAPRHRPVNSFRKDFRSSSVEITTVDIGAD